MKRFNMLVTADQVYFLGQLPGSISEHIRAAIEDYIKKKTPKAMTSPSLKVHKTK
jgi:hypothetical protein